jgi:hypothetical protein
VEPPGPVKVEPHRLARRGSLDGAGSQRHHNGPGARRAGLLCASGAWIVQCDQQWLKQSSSSKPSLRPKRAQTSASQLQAAQPVCQAMGGPATWPMTVDSGTVLECQTSRTSRTTARPTLHQSTWTRRQGSLRDRWTLWGREQRSNSAAAAAAAPGTRCSMPVYLLIQTVAGGSGWAHAWAYPD